MDLHIDARKGKTLLAGPLFNFSWFCAPHVLKSTLAVLALRIKSKIVSCQRVFCDMERP
jgi:hypothetical protein